MPRRLGVEERHLLSEFTTILKWIEYGLYKEHIKVLSRIIFRIALGEETLSSKSKAAGKFVGNNPGSFCSYRIELGFRIG